MIKANEWLFFLDESGHEQKESPQIVFGGFGIEAAKFESFKVAIEAAYFEAFGYPLADKSEELKGKFLLKRKEFKEAGRIEQLPDEERKDLIAQLRTKSGNASFSFRSRVAKGQASILFVESVFRVIKAFDCFIVANVATAKDYERLKPVFTSDFLKDMERATYHMIFKKFTKNRFVENNVTFIVDKSNDKQDYYRREDFIKTLRNLRIPTEVKYEDFISKLSKVRFSAEVNAEIKYEDSNQNIGLSVADIIIYCLNYGLCYHLNTHIHAKIRPEINMIIMKHFDLNNEKIMLQFLTDQKYRPRLRSFLKPRHLKKP